MLNPELYNFIFKRKSVRKYDMTPLPQEKLERLLAFTENLVKLDDSIKYEFSILSADKVKSFFAIKAPHYICMYSENKDGYLINAGFVLQQIDLFLSANNMGSCWVGGAKPDKAVPMSKNGLDYVIMLAFGNPAEAVHREGTAQFKRNSLADITSISGLEELLEPVRLAPSAANSQPWFFSGNSGEMTVGRKKLNMVLSKIYGKMNSIDIGIALCHLWLSAEHQGKTAAFKISSGNVPSGYEYMATVKVEG